MKGLWKRIGAFLLTACCVLGCGFVGVKWLAEAIGRDGETDVFTVALAAAWLVMAAVWLVRAVREYRDLRRNDK